MNVISFPQYLNQLACRISDQKLEESLKPCGEVTSVSNEEFLIFRQALYDLYGHFKVNSYCRSRGFDLEKASSLSRRAVIKIMLGLSESMQSDLFTVFRNIKLIDKLGLSALKIPSGRLEEIEDPRLRLIWRHHPELWRSLQSVESISELTSHQFQELIDILTPVKNMPEILGLAIREDFGLRPATCWTAFSYDASCFNALAGREMLANERIQLASFIADLPGDTYEEVWEAYLEHLTKRLAYKELPVGSLMPAPNSRNGTAQFYHVHQLCVGDKGMVAFILTRATTDMVDLPATILFRGSAFYPSGLGAMSTFMTDVEFKIGKMAFDSGKESLFSALKKVKFLVGENEIQVLGHSLGGTIAERFSLEFIKRYQQKSLGTDSLQNISKIRLGLYNSPGVGASTAREFQTLTDAVDFYVEGVLYKAKGDFLDLFGGPHIGSYCDRMKISFKVVVQYAEEICTSLAAAHIGLFLSRANHLKEKDVTEIIDGVDLEVELGNETAKAGFLEFVRLIFGLFSYLLLVIPYLIIRCCCGWRGSQVEENNLEEIQRAFTDDLEYLSNLLQNDEESPLVLEEGKRWLKQRLEFYLDTYLSSVEISRRDNVRSELIERMRTMKKEKILDVLFFSLPDVKLNEDFFEKSSLLDQALVGAFGELT